MASTGLLTLMLFELAMGGAGEGTRDEKVPWGCLSPSSMVMSLSVFLSSLMFRRWGLGGGRGGCCRDARDGYALFQGLLGPSEELTPTKVVVMEVSRRARGGR